MPVRRRIVPDASVVVPAFFRETLKHRGADFDLSKRAEPLADAVLSRSVAAIAPEHLIHEFAKVAFRKTHEGIEPDQAKEQLQRFLHLWDQAIRSEPMSRLAEKAWKLCTEDGIAPPDVWYLACAIEHEAELWISHKHKDGFADKARKVYKEVFVLTERSFGQS